MLTHYAITSTLIPIFFVGCVHTSAIPPAAPESGVRENELAARQHELVAENHRRTAEELRETSWCPPATLCWSSTPDRIAEEQKLARLQMKLAAEHRARVQALRDAEERACSEVTAYDRAVSPFSHQADIRDVSPLVDEAKPVGSKVVGIVVVFREVRGLTVERLQRIADCHVARNEALGHDVPELHDCPLVPRVTTHVALGFRGVTITIRGRDAAAVNEVLRRSRTIAQPQSISSERFGRLDRRDDGTSIAENSRGHIYRRAR